MATIVAGYLLWATTGDRSQVMGCSPGSGCDKVLGSRWSLWMDQPVTLFALAFYVPFVLLTLALRSSPADRARWLPWMMTVGCAAAIIMLWFIGLQVTVIGSLCVYCLTDHVLGLLAIACLILYAKQSRVRAGIGAWILTALLAGGFITAHVLVQPDRMHVTTIEDLTSPSIPGDAGSVNPTKTSPVEAAPGETTPAKPSRVVSVLNKQVSFDMYEIPHIGSSEAEFVILEMFDYTCSHCRSLHPVLHQALERYGDRLAIVTLPVPMNKRCNPLIHNDYPVHQYACEYALLSMAVCTIDREQYEHYHDWLMTGAKPPSVKEAKAKAEAIVGAAKLDEATKNKLAYEWMADGRNLYQLAKMGAIPKLVVGKQIIDVPYATPERLFALFESSLGIKPVGPGE